MAFYGFNRAALNAGVSGIIAGAALVVAVSTSAAQGLRTVNGNAPITAIATAQANGRLALQGASSFTVINVVSAAGTKRTPGNASFIPSISLTATPALLQMQTANITVSSGLKATATNAWAVLQSQGQATGYVIKPGASTSVAVATGSAEGQVKAGFASNIEVISFAKADASVKLFGQSTWQRDGYAVAITISNTTSVSLRTAQGFSDVAVQSDAQIAGDKIHGGSAVFTCFTDIQATGAIDTANFVGFSTLWANPAVIQYSAANLGILVTFEARETLTHFANTTEFVCASNATASGRLALQTSSNTVAVSNAVATGRLAVLGAMLSEARLISNATGRFAQQSTGSFVGLCEVTAFGVRIQECSADIVATSDGSAQWSLLIQSSGTIQATSTVTALAYTNAESLDPDARTMLRPYTNRLMARSFTDRTMRRTS